MKQPSDQRIHVLAAAFKEGYTIDQLYELTKIDKWFLYRMKCIMDYALKLKRYRDDSEVHIFSFEFVNYCSTYTLYNFYLKVYFVDVCMFKRLQGDQVVSVSYILINLAVH